MDEQSLLDSLARWVWAWRWRRHKAWLQALAIEAQERAYAQPWGIEGAGSCCQQPRQRPGQMLAVHLRDLDRIEEELSLIILAQ